MGLENLSAEIAGFGFQALDSCKCIPKGCILGAPCLGFQGLQGCPCLLELVCVLALCLLKLVEALASWVYCKLCLLVLLGHLVQLINSLSDMAP